MNEIENKLVRDEFHEYMIKNHGNYSIVMGNSLIDWIIVWHYALGETEAMWRLFKYAKGKK